jgi:hydrogenase nickel incorporation protein HypB
MRKEPITETEEIFDIELEENLLRKNRELAEGNRKLLDEHGIRCLDVLGSIGSGKTTLITEMLKRLKGRMRVAVLAGDLTTMIDAERIEEQGVPVVQIHTGKECHLDANLVKKALAELDLDGLASSILS